ncbi:MAG TPA: hypothetical protein VKR06_09020 [Ktedonosporobacter sp.]|nr:hypothetical protein [Ktedonosporobacter sp.]
MKMFTFISSLETSAGMDDPTCRGGDAADWPLIEREGVEEGCTIDLLIAHPSSTFSRRG